MLSPPPSPPLSSASTVAVQEQKRQRTPPVTVVSADLPSIQKGASVCTDSTANPSCFSRTDAKAVQKARACAVTSPLDREQELQKLSREKGVYDFIIASLKPGFGPFPESLPGCGLFSPKRFADVMVSLTESSYLNLFPKNIIGVGSGLAFVEKFFDLMEGVKVKCYDREPQNKFLPVEQAQFPQDIEKCLPDDCSGSILVAGYPQGYLGPVLAEFIARGGEMLCTTVESDLFCEMHSGYEQAPSLLRRGIDTLREKKSGECFEVRLKDYSAMAPDSYIQFYNWPSAVKQRLFNCPELKDFCSDIKFYDSDSDSD